MALPLFLPTYCSKCATSSAMVFIDCHLRFVIEVCNKFKLLNFYRC